MGATNSLLVARINRLGAPLGSAPAVGPKLAAGLEQAFGYLTVRDLLEHYPRRYLTRGGLTDIGHARAGTEISVVGEVREVRYRPMRDRKRQMLEVVVSDGSGAFTCSWFNRTPWHRAQLQKRTVAVFAGKLEWRAGRLTMTHPEYEVLREGSDAQDFAGALIPQYPATRDLGSGKLRGAIGRLLDQVGPLPEFLPAEIRRQRGLVARADAMEQIHRPTDHPAVEQARQRLVYDELFLLQVALALRRRSLDDGVAGAVLEVEGPLTARLVGELPFELTAAQHRALREIGADLAGGRPMHRLLQGDVGSGKTVVALWALLCAVQSGYQGAIMAPTEVLADQHIESLRALLAPFGEGGLLGGPRVGLLTASITGNARDRVRAEVAAGEVDIVVGTHALLSEGVDFARLGIVVVDEQHRFGVRQRVRLREKGDQPHVLVMTATPIPRTLALTLYGDLDVSTLDELPPGRRPVSTHVVADEGLRNRAYERIREEVRAGHQAYVVCALKDESDKVELRSAKAEAERLRAEVFPELRVGLVHGEMPAREKEATMDAFRAGAIDVLVSTTVVEVGVDVPNATVIVVEDADRFGLSQLHQLRGRVGRGTSPGLCILFTDPEREEASARMEAIRSTTDGFALAEQDLRIRGEGTLFDARQSGLNDLKLASLARDLDWVIRARDDARRLVADDPELGRLDHQPLRAEVRVRLGARHEEWLASG